MPEEIQINGLSVQFQDASFIAVHETDQNGNALFDSEGEPLMRYLYKPGEMFIFRVSKYIKGKLAYTEALIPQAIYKDSNVNVIDFLSKNFEAQFDRLELLSA